MNELIKKKEVMVLLDCSLSKIDNLIKSKTIPYYKIGESVRFRKKEIFDWIEEKKKDVK